MATPAVVYTNGLFKAFAVVAQLLTPPQPEVHKLPPEPPSAAFGAARLLTKENMLGCLQDFEAANGTLPQAEMPDFTESHGIACRNTSETGNGPVIFSNSQRIEFVVNRNMRDDAVSPNHVEIAVFGKLTTDTSQPPAPTPEVEGHYSTFFVSGDGQKTYFEETFILPGAPNSDRIELQICENKPKPVCTSPSQKVPADTPMPEKNKLNNAYSTAAVALMSGQDFAAREELQNALHTAFDFMHISWPKP